jgi:hypothetical protein
MVLAVEIPTSSRRQIAEALVARGSAVFSIPDLIRQVPKVKATTINASVSALKKTGWIEPARSQKAGRWFKLKDDILSNRDPVQFIIDSIESHSVAWRTEFSKHVSRVLPSELRQEPKYLLVAYLDSREKSPEVRRVAKAIRASQGDVSEYVQALERAGLATWDGNKIRKDRRAWSIEAAVEAMRQTGLKLNPRVEPVAAPEPGSSMELSAGREGPTTRMVQKAKAQGRPETVETMAEGLDTLQAILQEKSLLEVIRDYREAIRERDELKGKLAQYANLAVALEALSKLQGKS